MALLSFKVTQTGSAVQISASPLKVKWVTFCNAGAAGATVGDSNVSATQGVPVAATTGVFSPPVPFSSTFGHDLTQWYTIGTSTQTITVLCDTLTF